MSKAIPEGWIVEPLTNLITAERGNEPGAASYCEPSRGVRFLRVGDLSGKTDNPVFTKADGQLRVGPEDILFTLDGSPGLVAKGFNGVISSGIRLVKPNNRILRGFIYYSLQSSKVQSIVKEYTTGTTILHASQAIDNIQILLPPLPEQQKIAAILGSVDKAIEKTRAVIEQTRSLKRAMMQELLTRGIPGRHKKFKKTPIGEIPEEWVVVRLGDIAHVQTGIAKNTKNRPENMIKVPYLRVANVQDGYVDLSEIKHIEVDSESIERYLLRKGDVLFNEGGDNDKLGRGCVWEAQIDPCLHQNHVFAVRCSSKLTPYYLATYAASPKGKEFFLSSAKQTTNLASINSTQLKAFAIPLPPIREQQDIMNMFKQLDNRLSVDGAVLDGLGRMKDALMQNLLTGQIRVKG